MQKSTIIKSVFSLALLAVLLYKIGFGIIMHEIVVMNMWFIPLVVITWLLLFILGTMNFWVLLTPLNFTIPFFELFKHYFLSWSIGLVVPGKLGEFSIAYFLNKNGIGYGTGLAISVIDKVITLITLIAISTVGFFVYFPVKMAVMVSVLFWIGMITSFFLLLRSKDFVKKYILKSYADKLFKFSSSIHWLMTDGKMYLFLNGMLTIVKWLMSALGILFLFMAFGVEVSFTAVFLMNCMITIISLIPITMNGLGLKESGAVFLFSEYIFLPTASVAGVYVMGTVLTYLIAAVGVMMIKS